MGEVAQVDTAWHVGDKMYVTLSNGDRTATSQYASQRLLYPVNNTPPKHRKVLR